MLESRKNEFLFDMKKIKKVITKRTNRYNYKNDKNFQYYLEQYFDGTLNDVPWWLYSSIRKFADTREK